MKSFISQTSLWNNVQCLHYIDQALATENFVPFICACTRNGFLWYFYLSSDDLEHHSRNRHVLIISLNNSTNINSIEPSFRHVTSSVNKVKSNNYSKNADAIIAMLGIRIAMHYGGGTNDNAADVQKEIRCTFENIMSTAKSDDNFDERSINNMLYENGVERRVLGFGNPFHIANLCVTCSMRLVIPRKPAIPKYITASSYRASIHYILRIFPSPKLKWTV